MRGNWNTSFGIARLSVFFGLLIFSTFRGATEETTNAPVQSGETNSQELRTYLQLQEQLHATRLTIESVDAEARQTAAQNAERLAVHLQALKQAVAAQRAKELETMQSSNRNMLF